MQNKKFYENTYAQYVKQMEKMMGHNQVTYSGELNNVGKKLFGKKFKGVFPKDKLPYIGYKQCFIFNLDNSNQPGSHWCAMVKEPKYHLVYDSFGRNVLRGKKYGKFKYTEKDAEQKKSEDNCGMRCLAWLKLYYQFGHKAAAMI